MRTPRLALAASAALVATGLAVPGFASHAADHVEGCLQSVPDPGTTEPVKICYTIHKPAGATAEAPVPMMLHSHGWGGSRSKSASSFTSWLDKGFGVLSFDQRGFGESTGLAHVENPDLEGQDVKRIVDVVASLDWVAKEAPETTTVTETRSPGKSGGKGNGDKDGHSTTTTVEVASPFGTADPVLGAMGGSYGGGYQFVGAFTELRDFGATRFDALAPEITWFDLKEALAPQEVARSTWLTLLQAAGIRDVPRDVITGYGYGAATGMWPGKGNPVVDLDAFFEKNGPKWHVSQGRQLDIPVLLGQGINDNLFNLNEGLKNYDQALTPAARAQSIFVGYNGGHTLPNALPAGFGGSGDACSKQLGGESFRTLAQKFMQQNLKGIASGLTGFGQYHLANTGGGCVTVDSVQPNTSVALGNVATTAAAGAPISYELGAGPLRVAGQPLVDAAVTSVGVNNRAFLALSVGTTPLDAKVVSNNVLPLNELLPVVGAKRTIELPAVVVDVPAGQKLFLTVSPVSDMFIAHGSRTPGALVLQDTVVRLPLVAQP